MAMNNVRLAGNIITALKALNPDLDTANEAVLRPYWEAISQEIITEIIDNIQITTTVQVPNIQTGTSTAVGNGQNTDVQ